MEGFARTNVVALQILQALELQYYSLRLEFCNWFNEDRNFSKYVLYTDEAKFTSEGIFKSRNSHI